MLLVTTERQFCYWKHGNRLIIRRSRLPLHYYSQVRAVKIKDTRVETGKPVHSAKCLGMICGPFLRQRCAWALTPSIVKLKLTRQFQPPHRSFQLPNISVCCCHSLSVGTIPNDRDRIVTMAKNYGPLTGTILERLRNLYTVAQSLEELFSKQHWSISLSYR